MNFLGDTFLISALLRPTETRSSQAVDSVKVKFDTVPMVA
jgi:hypothetical protein